ncbi:hypothetical protein NIES806_11170 [Dolichospermum compactum NIES-806]|uniref:Uncharacterized protein n=1 Tax=Dolichospermum compactum NIES-806 TaxID=1973481 RepID=A0A1Z4V092_9CYAN|nr:hypothetical protein NIES806_11170 [Dolichospermum compactum NIES-806]
MESITTINPLRKFQITKILLLQTTFQNENRQHILQKNETGNREQGANKKL